MRIRSWPLALYIWLEGIIRSRGGELIVLFCFVRSLVPLVWFWSMFEASILHMFLGSG